MRIVQFSKINVKLPYPRLKQGNYQVITIYAVQCVSVPSKAK